MSGARTIIEVCGVDKEFQVPGQQVDTLKERVLHPLRSPGYQRLVALQDISVEIPEGEFFGIVGRNGSGKTTLLKLIASVYGADRGTIRVAGRIAPVIELGVGFNAEMNARDNVVTNGVMMGLTPKQARAQFDAVIDFAELEDFVDLKLKNYSSGMWVRLAFATMVQADADIVLVDEVLAVGDASFQRKCAATFGEMKAQGKTIVYVTHAMSSLEEFCDRAMLLEAGRTELIGDPQEVATLYYKVNFGGPGELAVASGGHETTGARIADVWLENDRGERTESFAAGSPIRVGARIEAVSDLGPGPCFSFDIRSTEGDAVFALPNHELCEPMDRIRAGEALQIRTEVANLLAPGHYVISCSLPRTRESFGVLDFRAAAAAFSVGGDPVGARVKLPYEVNLELERGEDGVVA